MLFYPNSVTPITVQSLVFVEPSLFGLDNSSSFFIICLGKKGEVLPPSVVWLLVNELLVIGRRANQT
jgi:hypothetical protein